MANHRISKVNWTSDLANTIEKAEDGDTILCHSPSMIELAERARQRMCPDKVLIFREEGTDVDMGRIHQQYGAD